jgi:hypothetical protein
VLDPLEAGGLHAFSAWESATVPAGPPGVYTVWRADDFLYVGTSYRDSGDTTSKAAKGLRGRRNSHASGRRSGDPFYIYIYDWCIVPKLTSAELRAVGTGGLSLDALTRAYLHEHLGYRYVLTSTGEEARRIEADVRRFGLPSGRRPALNPLRQTARRRAPPAHDTQPDNGH